MPRRSLTDTLRHLVHRHGISAVLHSLAEIESGGEPRTSSARKKVSRDRSTSKPSATACVSRMALAPQKTDVMKRAAQMFDDKRFLPTIADIREFSRVHGIELPKTASRASSVPRVFTFLASMDTDAIVTTLDDGRFSGPTRLGPIADAIRGRSATRRHGRRPIPDHSQAETVAKRPRTDATPPR